MYKNSLVPQSDLVSKSAIAILTKDVLFYSETINVYLFCC
jgi:hypothetical protein